MLPYASSFRVPTVPIHPLFSFFDFVFLVRSSSFICQRAVKLQIMSLGTEVYYSALVAGLRRGQMYKVRPLLHVIMGDLVQL